MYLLNTEIRKLEQFVDHRNAPKYGILSHTWEDEEVTYLDMQSPSLSAVEGKRGYRKIDFICDRAEQSERRYAWIDTCCIDKSSSAELSEAINSMFLYYERAVICWVWLTDLSSRTPISWTSEGMTIAALKKCRWFARG